MDDEHENGCRLCSGIWKLMTEVQELYTYHIRESNQDSDCVQPDTMCDVWMSRIQHRLVLMMYRMVGFFLLQHEV